MIICVCRNIKDSDFNNTQDLIDAVMSKEDLQCGKCQEYVKNSLMLEIGIQDGGSIPPRSTIRKLMRNFEVLSVEESPGGPGPDRLWKIHYKAYIKKQWKTDELWVIARNAKQARERAMIRFGEVSL